jgi:Fic family protein
MIKTINRLMEINMDKNIQKWIWQHEAYPHFRFDSSKLTDKLIKIEHHRGILEGISKLIAQDDSVLINIDAFLEEAINTSEIEGEIFQRQSVRDSLLKKLDANFDSSKDSSTHQSDNLVEILMDCATNKSPLTEDRLHGWHNCLFENRFNALEKIRVASFRESDDMEVVSGAIGHEKVHYKAPPSSLIADDIARLLEYCNESDTNAYIKSAIAHLWFVIIHPYEDGNGRIARAIADYIISLNNPKDTLKLYSLSWAINKKKKEYYKILDRTTNLFYNRDYDITPWLEWHLDMFDEAMLLSQENITYIIQKTKFWDRCRDKELNERQVKVLNKILNIGVDGFDGGLSTKKYLAITKTSKATVARDIKELVDKGCIKQVVGTSGRNTRYEVVL